MFHMRRCLYCIISFFVLCCSAQSLSALTVLLVTQNSGSLTSEESARKSQFESWGYTVTTVEDGSTQTEINTAATTADVVYLCEEISGIGFAYKARELTVGVISEERLLDEKLGFASSNGLVEPASAVVDIIDNTHAVTSGLSTGSISIFSSDQAQVYCSGTLAVGLIKLGQQQSGQLLLGIIDTGDTLANTYNGSNTAAGRRVRLPWGGDSFAFSSLNSDGLLILKQSIEWAAGGSSVGLLVLSSTNSATIGGQNVEDADAFEFNPGANISTTILDGSAVFTDTGSGVPGIDALHVASNGLVLFSTDRSASLNGVSFDASDIVLYNPSNGVATIYLKGTSIFSSTADINALCQIDNGNILLSTAQNEQIGGLSFEYGDVVEYNSSTGTATIYFDASSFYATTSNTDGVHLLGDGTLLLSTVSGASLGALSFQNEDVIQFDPNTSTATIYLDGNASFSSDEDVDAISVRSGELKLLLGHWKLDEGTGTTFVDSSIFGNDAAFSSSSPTWTNGTRSNALQFDGVDDEAVSNATFDPPETGTVAFWFKSPGAPSSRERLFGTSTSWEVRYETSGRLAFDLCVSAGFSSVSTVSDPDRWYHIAAVYDKVSSTYMVYIDGKLMWSDTFTFADEPAAILTFGNRAGVTDNVSGTLDDIRVYNYQLTAAEIAEIHGLVGHWKLDETSGTTATDSSGVANHGAYTGGVTLGGTGPYPADGINAADFDGTDGAISIPYHSAYDITETLTITAWIECDLWKDNGRILQHGTNNNAYALLTEYDGADKVFRILLNSGSINNAGTSLDKVPSGLHAKLSKWYHIALVCNGTDAKLYVDGVLLSTWSFTSGFGTIAEGITLGDTLDGRLFDVRLYNRALFPYEIAEIYGLVGHWKLDELAGTTAVDSSSMCKDGTYMGGTVLGEIGPKTTVYAAEFDGIDDHVILPSYSTDFRDGYCLTAWAKPTETMFWAKFIELGNGADTDNFLLGRNSTTSTLNSYLADGSLGGVQQINATNTIINNEWHHYAVTVSSTGFARLYLDGTEIATGGIGTPGKAVRNANYLGKTSWDSTVFKGQMYDVRLYNRPLSLEDIKAVYQSGIFQGIRIKRWLEVK